jgi:hypothetical protein
MERPTCGTCPYWTDEDGEVGACRRYAPRPKVDNLEISDVGEDAVFAFMNHDQWCGEHPDFPAYIAATRPPASPAAPTPDPAPRTAE